MDFSFYHLTTRPVEQALPRLLSRVIKAKHKAVVRVGSEDRMLDLDKALWTYDPASFLPHGCSKSGNADRQPIYITAGAENPNGADILVLIDGVLPMDLGEYKRCLYMFDGENAQTLILARRHWKKLATAGHDITYWQQTSAGGWQQQQMETDGK